MNYRDSLKDRDTEEPIDLAFYRPIGYLWARLAYRLGVTPNMITIASIFLGVGAGIAFYPNKLWVNAIGMFLLVWANSFDSADGQLARLTGQYSRIGRILDGLSGDIWFVTIYVAICLREVATSAFFGQHPWAIWLLAVVTGICHIKQASMADYYRQFHLFFVKGEKGSELDTADELRAALRNGKPVEGSLFRRLLGKISYLFMYTYANYTANQEVMTPAMQRLRRSIRQRWGKEIPQRFREDFRAASKPLMKYTNILSFNTRVIALFISLFIGQPWIYFVFELTVLNALLVYMMTRHERICKRFTAKINDGYYDSIKSINELADLLKGKSEIKTILFDFGGTIDTGGVHWFDLLCEAYRECGKTQSGNGLPCVELTREAYVEAERELEKHPPLPTTGFGDLLRLKVGLELNHLGIDNETLTNEISSYCERVVRENIAETKGALQQLAKEYRLGIVSNYYGNIDAVLAELGIAENFTLTVDSAIVGIRKPDAGIWRHALDKMGATAETTVVVGDSLKNDINPAISLNIKAIHLTKQSANDNATK